MLFVVGAAIVIVSVIGGFMLHGGEVLVLNQPSEFLIIGGAAAGSLVIGTPAKVLRMMAGQLRGTFGSPPDQKDYLELLSMLYQLFRLIQQSGMMALESHVESPEASPILSKFPKFLARHHEASFLADSIKVMIMGGISAHDLESLMDEDLQVHHDEESKPATTLTARLQPAIGRLVRITTSASCWYCLVSAICWS